ncbi:MAG: ammonium transporter [Actinobacteria bacterium]|nr:ammonium transporter [Actinomycetota bacterium]
MNTGDVAWMLVATALVLFMTPGLAFFYGGMVRAKNVLGMLMQNFFAIGLLAVIWAVIGFTLAFGRIGDGGLLGGFSHIGLRGVSVSPVAGMTIPFVLFCAYQMTFAVITPALITGATADRLKFSAYAIFIGVWLVLVYSPVAHWLFGGGWLAAHGALDFAGGVVVHVNAGAAALALILVLGKRHNWPGEAMHPHSLPLTLLGTGILWFGWFGFNAGSALGANGVASIALIDTFLAGAAGMLGWLVVERIKDSHPTTLGAASGAVAGLAAVTPGAGYLDPMSALLVGLISGAVCFFAVSLKFRFGYDDALDVIGVHLVGGLFGTLAVGLLAHRSVAGIGTNGLFFGGGLHLLGAQAMACAVVFVFSFGVSYVLARVLDATIGLRVTTDDEQTGLDQSLHAETAYTYSEFGSMGRR